MDKWVSLKNPSKKIETILNIFKNELKKVIDLEKQKVDNVKKTLEALEHRKKLSEELDEKYKEE